MSEIEKMYENCGIYPDCRARECGLDYCANSSACGYAVYPAFTSEKQLELIKTLETKCDYIDCVQIVYRPMENLWKITIIPFFEMSFEEMYLYFGCDKDFSTALAMAINNLWQDLTEEEKQQVKGILE